MSGPSTKGRSALTLLPCPSASSATSKPTSSTSSPSAATTASPPSRPSARKDRSEQHLEHLRQTHAFDLHGYVLMPEHVHLLLSEPLNHPLATTLKILKQETAKKLIGTRPKFWQDRYYDLKIRTEAKRIEKLKYIHRNPVKRGLTPRPEDYPWSSAHHYATGHRFAIEITSHWIATLQPRQRRAGYLTPSTHRFGAVQGLIPYPEATAGRANLPRSHYVTSRTPRTPRPSPHLTHVL